MTGRHDNEDRPAAIQDSHAAAGASDLVTHDLKLVNPKTKGGHVVLTERDMRLLRELHDNVVMSFYQIESNVFTGRNHATVMNRLKRLEIAGLITRQRIPRIKAWQSPREIGVVFQITAIGLRELSKTTMGNVIHDRVPAISAQSLDHDLLLNDIKPLLLRRYEGAAWVNGKYLAGHSDINKIPDAILRVPGQDRLMAIELELQAKSSMRYREIVASLRGSQNLERVIYITPNRQIDLKIMSEISGFDVKDASSFKDNFFEFMALESMKLLAA